MRDERSKLGWQDAGLVRFRIDVDLDADVERALGGGVQAGRDLGAIDGVNPLEMPRQVPGLVRLDGTDEVPHDLEIRQRGDLRQGLLDVVFAELALACRIRGADFGGGSSLRHREQSYAPAGAVGTPFGVQDCGVDRVNSVLAVHAAV